jgi:multiple sugar transport system permease protein
LNRASLSKRIRRQRTLAHVVVICLILIMMFPFLWLLHMSIKPDKDIFAFPPKLYFRPTASHYLSLWQTDFRRSFVNSAVASVSSTILSLIIGVPAAYALSRASFKSEGKIALWILASRMGTARYHHWPCDHLSYLQLVSSYLDDEDFLRWNTAVP